MARKRVNNPAHPPPPPDVARARARYAGLSGHRGPDHPTTILAARDLRYEVLAEHVRRKLAEAPPFTPEQRAKLAALLRHPDDDIDTGDVA